jgi:hypothetical protein
MLSFTHTPILDGILGKVMGYIEAKKTKVSDDCLVFVLIISGSCLSTIDLNAVDGCHTELEGFQNQLTKREDLCEGGNRTKTSKIRNSKQRIEHHMKV